MRVEVRPFSPIPIPNLVMYFDFPKAASTANPLKIKDLSAQAEPVICRTKYTGHSDHFEKADVDHQKILGATSKGRFYADLKTRFAGTVGQMAAARTLRSKPRSAKITNHEGLQPVLWEPLLELVSYSYFQKHNGPSTLG